MKKWILLVLFFFNIGSCLSSVRYSRGVCITDENSSALGFEFLSLFGLNFDLVKSNIISVNSINVDSKNNFNYGLQYEYLFGDDYVVSSSLVFRINFTNLGYEFKQEKLNQNYELSYLSTNVSYKRLLFDSQFYVIGGFGLNYLYDVESEIETINANIEKIVVNKDFSGSEISNNYNRFDLVGSIGFGYEIYMEGYYISIEPKYNFSFFNHINENNQELKGMNFKNEFWSLNFGVSFPL